MANRNIDDFYKGLNKKIALLPKKQQSLIIQLFKATQDSYSLNTDVVNDVENDLKRLTHKMDDIYLPIIEVVEKLLGHYAKEILMHYIAHIHDYSYSTGYLRRPYRITHLRENLENVIRRVRYLAEYTYEECSVKDYLTNNRELNHGHSREMIEQVIAYELDNNNDQVFEMLQEIIYGENNTSFIKREMIRGILKSHNKKAYKMIGELLLAAKLQEGLRQSIVENMDEGTLEATKYLYKIIIDHDLIRYSSVVRALSVWTGLVFEADNTRVIKQCIQYGYECLTNDEIRQEYLASENTNKLVMSMWAVAITNEEYLYPIISGLMDGGKYYQKIVALYCLSQSQNSDFKLNVIKDLLAVDDLETQYWVLINYDYKCQYSFRYMNEPLKVSIEKNEQLEDKNVRLEHFKLLKAMLANLPKQEINMKSSIIEWVDISYTRDLISEKIIYLLCYDMDPHLLQELMDVSHLMSPYTRDQFINYFIKDVKSSAGKAYLIKCLGDKSSTIRELALKKLKDYTLLQHEVSEVSHMLRLKNGNIRQAVITFLLQMEKQVFILQVQELLSSDNENKRLGGLELIAEVENDQALLTRFGDVKYLLDKIESPTQRERIVMDRLNHTKEDIDNCYGLLEEDKNTSVVAAETTTIDKQGVFKRSATMIKQLFSGQNDEISQVFSLSINDIKSILGGMANLIHEHRTYEYESVFYGQKEKYLVGDRLNRLYRGINDEKFQDGLKNYPLGEIWRNYFIENKINDDQVLQLVFYLEAESWYRHLQGEERYYFSGGYQSLSSAENQYLKKIYPADKVIKFHKYMNDLPYNKQIAAIINAYFEEIDKRIVQLICKKVIVEQLRYLEEQKSKLKDREIFIRILSNSWIGWLSKFSMDGEAFDEYFELKNRYYNLSAYKECQPTLDELLMAYKRGVIDNNELIRECLLRKNASQFMRMLTAQKHKRVKENRHIENIFYKILHKVLDIECKRGDLATGVTPVAVSIQYYESMAYFVKILQGLDKENFVRGYLYSYGDVTKKDALSKLLKVCHPTASDDENKLRELLEGTKITDKRLIEAAMYAPQWIEIIGNYLGWKGLRSAAWFFHAHVNEAFSAEKETVVAHYSPITPVEFNDGAFDMDWFREAYDTIGEKRFKILYQSAKYISSGANHKRSQLFTDAYRGKLDLDHLMEVVNEKRNKDRFLCISILPLHDDEGADLLGRYTFIQKFLKESKKFGSQRQASEAKIVQIAMKNLARNAGYKDVIRLTWAMESKKMEEIVHYFGPKVIDDFSVCIAIDEQGKSGLKVVKKEKVLKSVPAKYRKHDYIIELKAVQKEIKEQFIRAKAELETSMVEGSHFLLEEIDMIANNPVLQPIINNLVLKVDESLGYYKDGTLNSLNGESYTIKKEDQILIAHPIHLYESGRWSDYQKDLFDRKIKQPFKQVFRELYLPNSDEIASGTISRRYAGHQVQPQKTAALLKKRLWTVSYEEGLQKVHYKEHIIAKIYALADWFSPADIESPTLEEVTFYDRKTYEPLNITSIPTIIFSEIMRDIDLVVSVAHVGGVDPEASLSTIEVRKAIVRESIRLLKLKNVTVENNHALIEGSLGEYSVHLGSGQVYQRAKGALYIIPVHSQHRGKVFLPFIDEDPKTSEIVSKILMMAQDKKIKDPQILSQIKKYED